METHILTGLFLTIQCYWDMKEQKIPLNVLILGGVSGLLVSVYAQRDCMDVCMALLPGISFLIIGWLSRECIGYGDGFVICVLGLFYSWNTIWIIIFVSLLFSAGAALVLFVVLKKKGNDTIPFIPFLLLGWFVNLCV